jgi:flagellar hook-length control protein FliK
MNEIQAALPIDMSQVMMLLNSGAPEGATSFENLLEKITSELPAEDMNQLLQKSLETLRDTPINTDINSGSLDQNNILSQWLSQPEQANILDELKSLKFKEMKESDLNTLEVTVPDLSNLQQIYQPLEQKIKGTAPEVTLKEISLIAKPATIVNQLLQQVQPNSVDQPAELHNISDTKDSIFQAVDSHTFEPNQSQTFLTNLINSKAIKEDTHEKLVMEQNIVPSSKDLIFTSETPQETVSDLVTYKIMKEFDFDRKNIPESPIKNNELNTTTNQNKFIEHQSSEIPNQQSIKSHITEEKWSSDVGDSLQWMTNNHIKSAKLVLNPRELGSIEAHIKIVDNKAEITLMSENALVRDTLEQSMPQLKEMFSTNDVNLSKVMIADQQTTSNHSNHRANEQSNFSDTHSRQDHRSSVLIAQKPEKTELTRTPFRAHGQIDYYA